jgi:hypothetical protein
MRQGGSKHPPASGGGMLSSRRGTKPLKITLVRPCRQVIGLPVYMFIYIFGKLAAMSKAAFQILQLNASESKIF